MQIHIPVRAPLRPVHKPLLAERFKTNLCQAFERQGRCEYEARCMFAHGSDDLRSKEMNLLDGLVTEDAIRNFAVERYDPAAVMVDPHRTILAERFKTRSCENFKRHGECSFAQRCMFAHGEEELRTTEMNLRGGLTTAEAIKTFQSECITKLREANRRRKRNLKKKTTRSARRHAVSRSCKRFTSTAGSRVPSRGGGRWATRLLNPSIFVQLVILHTSSQSNERILGVLLAAYACAQLLSSWPATSSVDRLRC
jgi:hypothetical protein